MDAVTQDIPACFSASKETQGHTVTTYSPVGWRLTDRDCTQQILLLPVSTVMQLCTAPLGEKEKRSKIKVNVFYHGSVVKGDCIYG